MPDALLTVFGGVVVAVISGAAMVLVSRVNTRGANKTATIPPYDKLAARLSELETKDEQKGKELARLRAKDEQKGRELASLRDRLAVVISDRDSLVAYVRQWSAWFTAGAQPPPPSAPSHLRDLLDPDAWDVAHITERTTTTTYATPPHHDEDDESTGP